MSYLHLLKGRQVTNILPYIRERLETIRTDGLTMTDKQLEEYLFKQGFHPMPFVRYTERPDICAAHLLEGHIAIMVDTSPSVILVPTTLFHHLQHAEEYRQAPLIGTTVRMIRFTGAVLSLLLLPFWYLLATKPKYLPDILSFIGPKEVGEVPLFIQLFTADVGIEVLRMAAIHTPTPMSTAMGLVAAIVIGQVAIDVGLFAPEVILYVAISAVFTFAIPSYELGITTKVFRIGYSSVDRTFRSTWIFRFNCIVVLLFMCIKTNECTIFMASSPVLSKSIVACFHTFSDDS